jgi:hypothetical protein
MATLEEIEARIRAMPEGVVRESGPVIADQIKELLLVTMRAQQTPDGKPWPKRLKGIGPVLVNAADALRVTAYGPQIFIRLLGIEARHHYGSIRGSVVRQQILRGRRYSPKIARAIGNTVLLYFNRIATSGARRSG